MIGKTTPRQIYIAEKLISILTHGYTNNSRLSTYTVFSKNKLTNSDWRDNYIISENNFDSVLFANYITMTTDKLGGGFL